MDRRSFLKMFGAASSVPVVLTAEKALGKVDIIQPFVKEENESKIVLANHIPKNLGEIPIVHLKDGILSYTLRGEDNGISSYTIGRTRAQADWIPGTLEYHLEFEAYITADNKELNKLVFADVSEVMYVWLDIKPSGVTHPVHINKQMKMVMIDKEITAKVENMMLGRFCFREVR